MTHKFFRHIYTVMAAAIVALCAGSCADPYLELSLPGEGTSDVRLDLSFNSFESNVATSRAAAGDAISDIDDVSVMVFTPAGEFVSSHYYAAGAGLEAATSTHRPAGSYDNDVVKGATVLLSLPYGRYHIYAVANMGHPSIWGAEIATEDDLRSLRFDWTHDNMGLNNQMCGIVTQQPDEVVTNREPCTVTVDRQSTQLHSWLQRAVSKATIAYDATALNDNIYIYIMSAGVRDIPVSCTMVENNVPQLRAKGGDNLAPAECLTDGQTIDYLTKSGVHESSRVVLAKGTAYGGLSSVDALVPGENVHTIDEESLFFYENMQGTHPKKHLYNNFTSKDNVAYGSYLEVKAYYVNKSAANPSKGEIIYRYMLGMNDTDDFNARRNTHYRVTLRFIGDANNPDWHIEYERPTAPTVEVPTPLYISYLYNQSLDVPIICYYDKENYNVKSVKVDIIDNPFTNPEHFYANLGNVSFGGITYNWQDPRYGFLSLNSHAYNTSIDMTQADAYLGSRRIDVTDAYDPEIKGLRLNVPVYTRPLNLMVPNKTVLTDLGFSGNNHFTHRERKAKLRVTVVFGSEANASYTATSTTEVDIIQVKRVVNPKGCWRAHDSMKPFTFTIMESEADATNVSSIAESDVSYTPVRSNGPWTARVYTESYGGAGNEFQPGVDWIQLSPKGANAWRSGPKATVTGSTNSVIEFDFRPKSTIGANETRFGVIEVLYHDNQCRHLIFVSQGFGTVRMGDKNDWMMGNLFSNGTEVDNPLMEGSMFKYGNADYAIRSRNGYSMTNENRGAGPFKDANNTTLYWAQRKYSGGKYSLPNTGYGYENYPAKFGEVPANIAKGFTDDGLRYSSKGAGTYRVATYEDFKELLDAKRFGTLFGVLYGNNSTATLTTRVDRYTDADDNSGMRGCFIYDRVSGNHLFLPIGNTGIGRRKAYYTNGSTKGYGMLKYANRDALMPESDAKPRPLMYDIYRKPGALYWFQTYATEGSTRHYALDINYFTYLVNVFDTKILYYYGSSTNSTLTYYKNTRPDKSWADENSDAAFLRRIKVN